MPVGMQAVRFGNASVDDLKISNRPDRQVTLRDDGTGDTFTARDYCYSVDGTIKFYPEVFDVLATDSASKDGANKPVLDASGNPRIYQVDKHRVIQHLSIVG